MNLKKSLPALILTFVLPGLFAAGEDKILQERTLPTTPPMWKNGRKENNFTLKETETEVSGKKVKALEITLLPGQGTGAEICFLFRPAVNIGEWTDFEFDVRMDSGEPVNGTFGLVEQDWKGSFNRPFVKSSTIFWGNESLVDRLALKNAVFHFASCDMASVQSRILSNLCGQLRFRFDISRLKHPAKVTLANMRFVVRENKYSAEYKRFRDYIRSYKPDYSDSSKYLLPPETNRLDRPVAVVKNGKALGSISYRPQDGVVVQTAAMELQKWIEALTGARVPVTDKIDDGLIQLAAGKDAFGGAFADAYRKLEGRDGFAIRVRDGRIQLYGAEPKGTMNAAFALLENNSDLIWARPHKEVGTVFTRSPDFTVVWGNNVLDNPGSPDRGWNGFVDREWMARNQCNIFNGGGGGDISWMNAEKLKYGWHVVRHLYGHNIGHFVYSKKYFNDHPEYYSLIDFKDPKTKKVTRTRRAWRQYCLTNPEMKKVFIENALEILRKAPKETLVLTIDMDDTLEMCLCEKCTAPVTLPDGQTVTMDDPDFRSTQYFLFLNDVMKAVNREFPKMQIKTLAYFWTLIPPRCEVDPNIRPEFALYPRPNDKTPIFAPENRRYLGYLEGWTEKAKNIDVYNYHGLGLDFPRPLSEVNAWDFRVFNKLTRGVSSEYKHNGDRDKKGCPVQMWDYSAIEFWVQTRLYWNPDRDVEQLRKYFIRRTFREAAPAIEKFYGAFRADWLQKPNRSSIGASGPGSTEGYILNVPGREEAMRGYLAEAESLVKHPVAAELVRRLKTAFEDNIAKAKAAAEKKKAARAKTGNEGTR